MKSRATLVAVLLGAALVTGIRPAIAVTPTTQCAPAAAYRAATGPVAFWSTEARCAIVPAGPGGLFGAENFGNKFPGEAAVYLAIVHVAIYDAAAAIDGGYRPYAYTAAAPNGASPAAAIATAAYETLSGLQPQLGANQAILDADYAAYMAAVPATTAEETVAKQHGTDLGHDVAHAVLAARTADGREKNPSLADLNPPAAGPGTWSPGGAPALGLRMPGIKPLALPSASHFRPDGPSLLSSRAYADDVAQVSELGRIDSVSRTPAQTTAARFWTDHDLRQWNDALLRLAAERGLSPVESARLLAMAHVAGGDAMIACFDAKYHFWFWRPFQAIPQADVDGNPATTADPSWAPLGATPGFPEYPSAHACHSSAVAATLDAFFGTDKVRITIDSRVTGTERTYARLHDVVKDVNWARVLVGFHFRNSDQEGATLGRRVARYVAAKLFQPLD